MRRKQIWVTSGNRIPKLKRMMMMMLPLVVELTQQHEITARKHQRGLITNQR
jgi:hypothetical protein